MKNRIYKYFFNEFITYFAIVLFALSTIIWTIQAVNFLDLVTNDGHAFKVYSMYSLLVWPKILTKLIPFSFLIATMLTILKLENELTILWTSGLNKIHIVNLIFRISLLVTFVQFLMSSFINPEILNFSRSILKNSELQFISSLLKERQFNDTVKGLTIFVDKKEPNGEYKNIFIRDDARVVTKISSGSSTIFAKSGFVSDDEKNLILLDGSIQKSEASGSLSIIKFERTQINLSGLSTKSIIDPKVQETSTLLLLNCLRLNEINIRNCANDSEKRDTKIEINKRIGMPLYIPLIAMISCFLLSSRKEKNLYGFDKYIYFVFGFIILLSSEIMVRYSGSSTNNTIIYYLIPIGLFSIIYLLLIRTFKYENLT